MRMKQDTIVFQGTFDPFTNGHMALLRQALSLYKQVLVLLLVNPAKKPLFCVEERKNLIAACVTRAGLSGVQIDAYEGLLADYMKDHGLVCCVRGVRNGRDAEFELENHRLSQTFYPSLKTLLLPACGAYQDISSSAVKAACQAGRLPSGWVPQAVADALQKKYPGLLIF